MRIWSREMCSAVPSRVRPLILHIQAENLVLAHGLSSSLLPPVTTSILTVKSNRVNPGYSRSRNNCAPMAFPPSARRHKAFGPQRSSSSGRWLLSKLHGPHFVPILVEWTRRKHTEAVFSLNGESSGETPSSRIKSFSTLGFLDEGRRVPS